VSLVSRLGRPTGLSSGSRAAATALCTSGFMLASVLFASRRHTSCPAATTHWRSPSRAYSATIRHDHVVEILEAQPDPDHRDHATMVCRTDPAGTSANSS
jgi:hypothetical protein